MKDKISESRVKLLHPKARPIFKSFIEEAENELGITLRVVQGLRTFAEQQSIYDQGRTKPGNIVTKAKPGSSFHNFGLSVDLVPLENGNTNWKYDYKLLKPFAVKYGLKWGGDFKTILDKPHFEISFGYTWRQLLEKHNKKDFINGSQYVNI